MYFIYQSTFFVIVLAGLPTAIEFSGMLLTTTEPAPMVELSPIDISPKIIEFVDKRMLLPITGLLITPLALP